MYRDTVEARYQRDAEFKAIVDLMEHMLHRAQYTPTEMREAAILACIHYEMRRTTTFTVPEFP